MELGAQPDSRPGVKHRASQHAGEGETSGDMLPPAPTAAGLLGGSVSHLYSAVTIPGAHGHHLHHHGVHVAAATSHGGSVHSYDSEGGHGVASYKKTESPECSPAPYEEPSVASRAFSEALVRGRWLLGLLIVQSTSSFVLNQYQDLLRDHLVVTLFLTMLVGAGGNAGNQSAIKVIRALATGSTNVSWLSAQNMLAQQTAVGMLLGGGLACGGFVRVYMTNGNIVHALAISISLFLIVLTSVVLGTGLPFVLAKCGIDPANAGTSIQVIMDILGVAITCVTCWLILVQLGYGLKDVA